MFKRSLKSTFLVLDPIDRVGEILSGLIMVLTFTSSVSVATAGRGNTRTMLIAALGCNLAWGVIDGALYLMGQMIAMTNQSSSLRAIVETPDSKEAQRLIAEALPPVVAADLKPSELEAIHQRLKLLPAPPKHARLGRRDWWGAIASFLLMFLSSFPVVVPFLLMKNSLSALRVSNAIAITLLFVAGYAFGRPNRRSSWIGGISMVVLGSALVGIAIILGG